MLFMALAVSWKGIAVSRVSVQTLFIIIIIIIINHPSSGVPGPSNALNHWPHLDITFERGEMEREKGLKERMKETGRHGEKEC